MQGGADDQRSPSSLDAGRCDGARLGGCRIVVRCAQMDLDLYPWLKYGHILLAVVAVGFNFSYGILIGRAAREPEHLGHVLRTVKLLDDRFANPSYGLLLLLGLAMVFVGPWNITDLWILLSLG